MKQKLYITTYGLPGEVMPTEYGVITYEEWLRKEQARFLKAGQTTEIIKMGDMIALIRK